MAAKVLDLSEEELLQTDLTGSLSYEGYGKSTKSCKVSHKKYLRNVYRWDDFEQSFNLEIQQLHNEKKYESLNLRESYLVNTKIRNETDLARVFNCILTHVFQKQILANVGQFYSDYKLNIGIADMVFILNQPSDKNQSSKENERVRLIIELKTKWVLKNPPIDLVQYYNDKMKFYDYEDSIMSSMIQLHTYMLRNKRKYGVLTSFNASYFFKLENDMDLFISDKISPKNLLKAFNYILDLSISDGVLNISWSTITDKTFGIGSSGDDEASNSKDNIDEQKRKRDARHEKRTKNKQPKKALEDIDENEVDEVLESGEFLSGNDSHTVKKTLLRNEVVKLKICDAMKKDPSDLENEAEIYKYLNSNNMRMGELVFSGLISGMFYTLCVKFINGQTIEFDKMSPKVKQNCINELEQLHSVGVMHGDLRHENFIVDLDENVFVIDFETSSKTKNKTSLKYEMDSLKRLLSDHDVNQ